MTFNNLASEFVPGVAWAGLLHLAPKLATRSSPNVAISVEGRFQYIPQPAQYSRFAAGGHLRAAQGDAVLKQARIRFSGTGIVEAATCSASPSTEWIPAVHPELSNVQDFKDTVRGGPIIRARVSV